MRKIQVPKRNQIGRVVETAMRQVDAQRVTLFIDEKTTLKATRTRRFDGRMRQETFVVTLGTPNYAERKFIKLLKAAGEPFPVKRLGYKWWPK